MDKTEIILLAGIIIALIWLGLLIKSDKRKYVILIGIMIDIVLFIICKNWKLLFIGGVGGLACGLIPNLGKRRNYEIAVQEMKGVKNWLVVSIIFFIMIFMTIAIAYPGLNVEF